MQTTCMTTPSKRMHELNGASFNMQYSRKAQAENSFSHYHILAGIKGARPELDDVWLRYNHARASFKELVNNHRELCNKLTGSITAGYFEVSEKVDSRYEYFAMSKCDKRSCLTRAC